MSLQILPSAPELYPSYASFIEELRLNGDKMWEGYLPKVGESPKDFIKRLHHAENQAEPGMVTESTYWGVRAGEVVGRISLRHQLNDNLKVFGGNIGYEVRPSARRQGVATQMLAQLLRTTRAKSMGKLLLTCAPNNQASIKTILNNGGRFEKSAYVEKWSRETHYYWIETQ